MEMVVCTSCSKNKTAIKCDSCIEVTCKHCSYFIDENNYDELSLFPKHLIHKTFCPACFSSKISPEIDAFYDLLKKANDVNIYYKEQGTETRFFRRAEKPLKVEEFSDKNEARLTLCLMAAEKGFNTLLDMELISTKSRLGGTWRKLVWSGTAVPINIKND